MSESKPRTNRLRRLLVVCCVLLALWSVVGFSVGLNAFGRNISGKVTCANGGVTGVFIQAERAPRVVSYEIQSGFADWWLHTSSLNTASFEYWLPFGGAYSVHVGCGTLQKPGTTGGWATDNRTPVVDLSSANWMCDNPVNAEPETVVATNCRQV
jgi:hypothetical protein